MVQKITKKSNKKPKRRDKAPRQWRLEADPLAMLVAVVFAVIMMGVVFFAKDTAPLDAALHIALTLLVGYVLVYWLLQYVLRVIEPFREPAPFASEEEPPAPETPPPSDVVQVEGDPDTVLSESLSQPPE